MIQLTVSELMILLGCAFLLGAALMNALERLKERDQP